MEDDRSLPLPLVGAQAVDMQEFETIPVEKWVAGEATIRRVLDRIRPTVDSEDKRHDVTEFMRQLIMSVGGVEVVPYGSVPLKTYLPQGDIDLTAVSIIEWNRDLPLEVYDVLLDEELNGSDEYKITQIKYIDAEVKLVKCIVNNIIIDISFNQLSGLCALCFLEQVDRLIGKDHLFKRSIILIKSWCYYESRILGAIYGLISTYALETLVLYIFLMYDASLTSPLKVLYRFLEYYSNFEWGKYCISIDGPVNISALPDIWVENPIDYYSLLYGESLRDYIYMFTVPCKDPVENWPTFTPKVMNIIDPLKENNNLGRSINLGTFYRIRLALSRGASELGAIMELPNEGIQRGIEDFFHQTLSMNESNYIFKPRLTFDNLSTNSPLEVDYEYESEPESLNSDLDTSINADAGVDGNDLAAVNLVPANEAADANVNANNAPDNGNNLGVSDESDKLKLVDLTGDYNSNVRKLLVSKCCRGIMNHSSYIAPEPPAGYQSEGWFHQNSSSHFQAYPNGSVMMPAPNLSVHGNETYFPPMASPVKANGKGLMPPFPNHQFMNQAHGGSTYEIGSSSGVKCNGNGPEPQSPQGPDPQQNPSHVQAYPNGSVVFPAPNLTVHGSETYIPAMAPPAIASGNGLMPPFPNLQPNQAQGGNTYEKGLSSGAKCSGNGPDPQSPQGIEQSSAPSPQVHMRKLEFGSFGAVSPTSPEPEKTYFLCARRSEKVASEPLPLKDENEFPPLLS